MNKKAIIKFLGAVCVMVLVCTTFFGYTPVVNVFDTVDELKEKYPQFTYIDLSSYVEEAAILIGGEVSEYEVLTIHDRNSAGCLFIPIDKRAVAGCDYKIRISVPNDSTSYNFHVTAIKEGSNGMFNALLRESNGNANILNVDGIETELEYEFSTESHNGLRYVYVGYAKFFVDNQTFYVHVEVRTILSAMFTEQSFATYLESMMADAIRTRTIGTLAQG